MPSIQPRFDFNRIDRRTKNITTSLIAAIREHIVQHLNPEKIILFGSQANGKAIKGSDIDLLIVIDDQHPLAVLKRRDRFGLVSFLICFAIAHLAWTPSFLPMPKSKNSE